MERKEKKRKEKRKRINRLENEIMDKKETGKCNKT